MIGLTQGGQLETKPEVKRPTSYAENRIMSASQSSAAEVIKILNNGAEGVLMKLTSSRSKQVLDQLSNKQQNTSNLIDYLQRGLSYFRKKFNILESQ